METYMRRFKMKKIERSHSPDSITIEAFQKEIKRDTSLFIKITKTTLYFLDTVYEKA